MRNSALQTLGENVLSLHSKDIAAFGAMRVRKMTAASNRFSHDGMRRWQKWQILEPAGEHPETKHDGWTSRLALDLVANFQPHAPRNLHRKRTQTAPDQPGPIKP